MSEKISMHKESSTSLVRSLEESTFYNYISATTCLCMICAPFAYIGSREEERENYLLRTSEAAA